MISPAKILSLTLGPKSLFLAELAAKGAGARPVILNLAEFHFPNNLSLSTPVELGQALASFLRAQKITARDLYIGLPARRLVTRRKDVPPASSAVAASTLRLQAESDFSSATGAAGEADAFVVDFAGQTSPSDPSSVLLIATAQSCIEQCTQLAKAANLRLRGVTASSAALARATASLSNNPLAECLILSLSSGAAELVVTHGSAPTQLRHLAIANAGAPESLPALAGEIRRTIASIQHNGTPLTLALWDDSPGDTTLLSERIGMPVTSPELRSIATQADGLPSVGSSNAYAPAVAVALAALSRPGKGGGLPVDFLHSRLAPPKESSKNRPVIIAVSVGALLVLLILLGILDIYLKSSHLDSLDTQSAAHADSVKTAQVASDRLDHVNRWVHRPQLFDPCIHDLTALVPDYSDTIWVTNISVFTDPKTKDVLTGQAVNLKEIKDLKDKMLAGKQFLNPTVTYPGSHSSAGSTEITFSIEFNYQPSVTTTTKSPETRK